MTTTGISQNIGYTKNIAQELKNLERYSFWIHLFNNKSRYILMF